MNYFLTELIPYAQEILPLLMKGLGLTLYIGIASFLGALVLGAFLAVIYTIKITLINRIIRVYVSFFRGTPLLMQVFLFYYGLPMLFEPLLGIPKIEALIFCMALNGSAYVCESVRGAIESIDRGQYEASIAFGMSHFQAMRRIIFPQASVAVVPTLTGVFLDLLKMSSIGMTIGVQELTGRAQLITATYYKAFETYFIAIIIYWILSIIFERVQKRIEIRISAAYQK